MSPIKSSKTQNQQDIEYEKSTIGIYLNFKPTIIQSELSMKQLLWKWEIKNDWIQKLEKLKLSFQILEFIQARFPTRRNWSETQLIRDSVPIGCWLLLFDWLLKTYLRRFISLGFVLTGVTILIFSAIGVIIYRNEIIPTNSVSFRFKTIWIRWYIPIALMKNISSRVVVEQAVSDSWDEWFFNSGAIDDDSLLKTIISPGKACQTFFILIIYQFVNHKNEL